MHEEWTDRLSDYLDDELSPEDRDALESHLAGCERCRATLDALRRVVERAGSLTPRPPAADLWTGIAARLDPPAAASGTVVPFGRREARRVRLHASPARRRGRRARRGVGDARRAADAPGVRRAAPQMRRRRARTTPTTVPERVRRRSGSRR